MNISIKNSKKCKKCGSDKMLHIEYMLTPQDYDGISEFKCEDCGYRVGRWSGKELKDGYIERLYGGEPYKLKTKKI